MNKPSVKKRTIISLLFSPFITGAFLFLPAGTLNYWQAWMFMGAIFIPAFFVIIYFMKNDPKLLERRMRMKEKEATQKGIMALAAPLFLIGFLLPGFDYRFGWSDVPSELVIVSNLIVFLAYVSIFFVMKENSYASRIVEVEKDQKVISTGPYAVVRHPMYAAVIPLFLFIPLALGSYWSIICFVPLPFIIIARLLNEEEVLKRDLPGYKEYCKKVKYRLIPHIW